MSPIVKNLQVVQQAIVAAAHKASRSPEAILLLAVSKGFGTDDVVEAAQAGQQSFGENYLQEAVDKIQGVAARLPNVSLDWHFIGPIQSNKTQAIATYFDWVHTIDRIKIAERLSMQRPLNLAPLNVCIQVNISEQATKSGVSVDEVMSLAKEVALLPNICLRGLMAIPEPAIDFTKQRESFYRLRELYDILNKAGLALDTLSMGMSGDMEAAIMEGATIVRIGTAIFGRRIYPNKE